MTRSLTGTLLGAVLAMTGLTACDATGPTPADTGFVASWGGQPWTGSAHASYYPTQQDTLFISGSNPPGSNMPLSYVAFRIIPDGSGTYVLGPGEAEFVYLIGGDVRTSAYTLGQGGTGTVVIEQLTATRVRGSVNFPMLNVYGSAPLGAEATFHGSFDARIGQLPAN
jgi:hypothetical protein